MIYFIWWMRRQLKQRKREEHFLVHKRQNLSCYLILSSWDGNSLGIEFTFFPWDTLLFGFEIYIWQLALICIGRLWHLYDWSILQALGLTSLLKHHQGFSNHSRISSIMFLQYLIIYSINAYLRCWKVRTSEFIQKREMSAPSLEQKRINIEKKVLESSVYFSKRTKIKL